MHHCLILAVFLHAGRSWQADGRDRPSTDSPSSRRHQQATSLSDRNMIGGCPE